jgi:glutamate synthase (NADPH/NADH) small chain
LAAAQQLNRAGHTVTVFERDEKVGGLLRYGIPDFKMEKHIIERRVSILEEEGIVFKTGVEVGKNYSVEELKNFDAVVLCGGATIRRRLPIPGSDAKGVVQAMDFLPKSNRWVDGLTDVDPELHAQGKNVIVIGGGDTGSDCIGTSNRQGAASVTNFEIMPRPADDRTAEHPWPYWPFKHKTSSSHEEGSEREFSIMTKEFVTGDDGRLSGLKTVHVHWEKQEGERPKLVEEPNSEKEWPCDLALLALGFTGPEPTLAEQLGIILDERSNINADTKSYQTNVPNIFAAGDMRRGQSLIVWAISEGREAAFQVDRFLMGTTQLPTKTHGDLPSHP